MIHMEGDHMTRENNQILYHYTDYGALNGILAEKCLRVNNVLNMNDAEEMVLFMRGIFEEVERRLEAEGQSELSLRLHNMLNSMRDKGYQYSAYAACFSTYRDDASQWERYGNRGKGICLGFRRDILKKMTGRAITLLKVFYENNLSMHPLVSIIHDMVISHSEDFEKDPELDSTIMEAWRNSASFKHPSFSSEHEIRLVVMPFEDDEFDIKPQYHISKERIKKYYPLDLEKMCRHEGVTMDDLLTELIIGPESTQSIQILQDYLVDLGLYSLAENVYYSDCPLRIRI